MDPPNLTSMPVEIVLLVADHLPSCADVLRLMRVYLVSNKNSDTAQRLQAILHRMDAKELEADIWCYQNLRRPAIYWAVETGNLDVVRSALAAYKQCNLAHRLYGAYQTLTSSIMSIHTYRWLPNLTPELLPDNVIAIKSPTLAMLAVQSGRMDILELVVNNADRPGMLDVARIMITSNWRRQFLYRGTKLTALTLAAFHGRLDMVKLLVDAGAKVHWTPQQKRTDSNIMASLCGWGQPEDMNNTSEAQAAGRLAILEYFLDRGYPVNEIGIHFFRFSVGYWRLPQRKLTPLMYATWDLGPHNLQQAQLLIRRGARYAPWTTWEDAPWSRERRRGEGPLREFRVSPFKWIVGGNLRRSWYWSRRSDAEEEAQHEAEDALFRAMMEEGVEPPITQSQFQWALEIVIYSGRCCVPRCCQLYLNWVRYLVRKGARVDELGEFWAEKLEILLRDGKWKMSDLLKP